MAYQAIFQRYELKFLLTAAQKEHILQAIAPHTQPDPYGKSTVCNLYFDTESYRLIRHSIEKPAYKEKLRIRSYGKATPDGPVFVELKKTYQSVVYKRRVSMTQQQALDWLCGRKPCPAQSQITREVDYFLQFYGTLRPSAFLSYEREAYYSNEDKSLRITFDSHILCRTAHLSLDAELSGTPILEGGKLLMEIKCTGGLPLWLTKVLSHEGIYKTSFSKYGTAYQTLIYPLKNKERVTYA